jgi:hypothetical protein
MGSNAQRLPHWPELQLKTVQSKDESVMTQLPHAFKRIRLELARSKEFPDGSAKHGYELVAPLDANDHIDVALWHKYHENCRVLRFWGDGEEIGYLLHKPGGPDHARWAFDYHKTTQHADEYGYRFGIHNFRFGEYVSIQDEAGDVYTFRVVSVAAVA